MFMTVSTYYGNWKIDEEWDELWAEAREFIR